MIKKGFLYKTEFDSIYYAESNKNSKYYIAKTLPKNSILLALNKEPILIEATTHSITRDIFLVKGYIFLCNNETIIISEKNKKHLKLFLTKLC